MIGVGIGGKRAYGLKVRTLHRTLQLFFEEEAERELWLGKIIAAQKLETATSETTSPRKSVVKTLLEEKWGINYGAEKVTESEKSPVTDKTVNTNVQEEGAASGLGLASPDKAAAEPSKGTAQLAAEMPQQADVVQEQLGDDAANTQKDTQFSQAQALDEPAQKPMQQPRISMSKLTSDAMAEVLVERKHGAIGSSEDQEGDVVCGCYY